jgi:Phage integrase family
VQKYEEHCRGEGLAAYPVSFATIGTFIAAHVQRNGGSTRSVVSVVSSLRVHCRREGLGWMSEADETRFREAVSVWQYEDLSASRRKRPLVLVILEDIIGRMDLKSEKELMFAVALMMGHDGLLRSGEIMSGLKVKDVTWERGNRDVGFQLFLERTKTGQRGPGVHVAFSNYGQLSAVALLSRWFEVRGLDSKPEAFIFPGLARMRTAKGTFEEHRSASTQWFRKHIKLAVESVGLDGRFYSGHSLRAGGATDLFMRKVPYHIIKKMGRWRSDAAMLYHRSDEDVERQVRRAFRGLTKCK